MAGCLAACCPACLLRCCTPAGHFDIWCPPSAASLQQMVRSDAAYVKRFLEERAAAEAAAAAAAAGPHCSAGEAVDSTNDGKAGDAKTDQQAAAAAGEEAQPHATPEAAPLLPAKPGSVDELCGEKEDCKAVEGIVPFWLPPERMPAPYSGQHAGLGLVRPQDTLVCCCAALDGCSLAAGCMHPWVARPCSLWQGANTWSDVPLPAARS